jgi:dienelactone hydrolase
MGASFQWREPRAAEARPLSQVVAFGRGRGAGTGYMSFSERVGPGVLVIHALPTLGTEVMGFADELRAEGFTVLVPELGDAIVLDDPPGARAVSPSFDEERAMWRLRAAAEHLTANWHPRLGAVGFCLGARFACALAQEELLDATVLYQGLGVVSAERWSGPLLGHFEEGDEAVRRADAEDLFSLLEQHDIDAEMHLYETTAQWPAVTSSPSSEDTAGAQLARKRTIDFLRYHLA